MIKFRAWDKEREKWSPYRIESLLSVDEVVIEFFDTCQGVWYTNEDIKDNWVLMQSTGLKDRFGTEIFESDIVTNGRGEVGYIAYLTQEAGWVVVTDKRDYRLGHRNTGESYLVADDHAVIGNTYEGADQ